MHLSQHARLDFAPDVVYYERLHGKETIKTQETLDTRRGRLLIYIRNHDPTTLFSSLDAQNQSMQGISQDYPRNRLGDIRGAFFWLQTNTRNIHFSELHLLLISKCLFELQKIFLKTWAGFIDRLQSGTAKISYGFHPLIRMRETCLDLRTKAGRFQSQEEIHHRKLSKILLKSYKTSHRTSRTFKKTSYLHTSITLQDPFHLFLHKLPYSDRNLLPHRLGNLCQLLRCFGDRFAAKTRSP